MREVILSQCKIALIDDEDFEAINEFKWYANKHRNTYYALRHLPINSSKKLCYMHRVIMKSPTRKQIDHIDGNGLNNQKSNLRICTGSQNQQNRTKRTSN